MEDKYNGWTNRETWCVIMWFDGDQDFIFEMIEGVTEKCGETREIAVTIEKYVIEECDCKSLRDDIGNLYHVNWLEIASSYEEDFRKKEAK